MTSLLLTPAEVDATQSLLRVRGLDISYIAQDTENDSIDALGT